MAKEASKRDRDIAKSLAENGQKHTADYVLMFGSDNMNPWLVRATADKREEFYKKCVEEQHPWYFYVDPPEEGDLY